MDFCLLSERIYIWKITPAFSNNFSDFRRFPVPTLLLGACNRIYCILGAPARIRLGPASHKASFPPRQFAFVMHASIIQFMQFICISQVHSMCKHNRKCETGRIYPARFTLPIPIEIIFISGVRGKKFRGWWFKVIAGLVGAPRAKPADAGEFSKICKILLDN